MRTMLYLFIVVALAARGLLFIFFRLHKKHRKDDGYFGAIFLAFSISYALYAYEAYSSAVLAMETLVDIVLALVVVYTTIMAFLAAIQNKGK